MAIQYNPRIITNGLSLCLDAGNPKSYPGSGNTWFDVSGNNKNFTWESSPSFSGDGISYFSTLNNVCTGPPSNSFGINNTSGYTIFVICKQNTLTEASSFKFYKNNLSSFPGRAIFAHISWTDNKIYFDQGGCCLSDTRTSAESGGTQSWNIWTFRRFTNSSTRSISKNGNTLVTNTNDAATLDLDQRGVDLGSSDELTDNWDANLSGFIVYNRGLSDDEITQNFNALRGRYGI